MAFGLQSYDDGSRRESLLSVLKDVSPSTDNYFVSNLSRGADASNTLHEWVVFNTARPTSVTFSIEGAEATYSDLSQPTRSTNVTGPITRTVRVSGTERAIKTATGEDAFTFQKKIALRNLKSDMEYATINGTRASGSSGVARGITGVDGCISTNVTARASGTSFTEIELNDILNDVWNSVGSDYVADLIVCPMVISRRISGFNTNMTRNIDAKEKRLVNQVRVYDSNVGNTVMIIPHKDVRAAAGTLTVYAIREEMFQHAFLTGREPMWEDLAKDGDRDNGQYVTEFTVVSLAERASAKRTGYATTL